MKALYPSPKFLVFRNLSVVRPQLFTMRFTFSGGGLRTLKQRKSLSGISSSGIDAWRMALVANLEIYQPCAVDSAPLSYNRRRLSNCSRTRVLHLVRLTLPTMSIVITSLSLLKYSAGTVEHLGQF